MLSWWRRDIILAIITTFFRLIVESMFPSIESGPPTPWNKVLIKKIYKNPNYFVFWSPWFLKLTKSFSIGAMVKQGLLWMTVKQLNFAPKFLLANVSPFSAFMYNRQIQIAIAKAIIKYKTKKQQWRNSPHIQAFSPVVYFQHDKFGYIFITSETSFCS